MRIVRIVLSVIAIGAVSCWWFPAMKAVAHDGDTPQIPPVRQNVMIGPFQDGRVVWCKGREENGDLIISDTDAASCRMDTSDVKPLPITTPHK